MKEQQASNSNPKQLTGSHYIITFYNDIQQLLHCYGLYRNFLNEIENTKDYADVDTENNTKLHCQNLRYYINKLYIQYITLTQIAQIENKEKQEEIKKLVEQCNKEFIIKVLDAENFVLLMNSLLVSEVLQNFLKTSEDIYSEIYEK